ncbi:MAG: hypothetical protein N4A40_00005 [Tissierellales bacterium]|jgi:hypothetical protein|nr:hypothetical protein [Tissierellales bacterium]
MTKNIILLVLGFIIVISVMISSDRKEMDIRLDRGSKNIQTVNVMDFNFTAKSYGRDLKYYTESGLNEKIDKMKKEQNRKDLSWFLVDRLEEAGEEYRYYRTFMQEHDEIDFIAVEESYENYEYNEENDNRKIPIKIPIFVELKNVKYKDHGWAARVE